MHDDDDWGGRGSRYFKLVKLGSLRLNFGSVPASSILLKIITMQSIFSPRQTLAFEAPPFSRNRSNHQTRALQDVLSAVFLTPSNVLTTAP